jgi:hypothetical protein
MNSRWVKYAAIFGFWTLLALLLAGSNFLYRISAGLPPRYVSELRTDLLDYWIWAALTPAIGETVPLQQKYLGANDRNPLCRLSCFRLGA